MAEVPGEFVEPPSIHRTDLLHEHPSLEPAISASGRKDVARALRDMGATTTTDRDTRSSACRTTPQRSPGRSWFDKALSALESTGLTPLEAIRVARLTEVRRRRQELAAEVAALEANEQDREEMAAVAEVTEALRAVTSLASGCRPNPGLVVEATELARAMGRWYHKTWYNELTACRRAAISELDSIGDSVASDERRLEPRAKGLPSPAGAGLGSPPAVSPSERVTASSGTPFGRRRARRVRMPPRYRAGSRGGGR